VHVLYAQRAGLKPPLKSRVFVDWVKSIIEAEVLAPLRPEAVSPH
jgi:hypothetical protein